MCGRYSRWEDAETISDYYGIGRYGEFSDVRLAPSFEVFPSTVQPVCIQQPEARRLAPMRWGFQLPNALLINIRSETVMESKFWAPRIGQRCVIPASSFFEWKKVKKGTGQKYEVTMPGRELFGFAGLWGEWKNPKTKEAEPTFALFTSEANSAMQAVHHRQPVIIQRNDCEEWLTTSERPPLHLLRILPEEQMLIAPVPPAAGPQQRLFG